MAQSKTLQYLAYLIAFSATIGAWQINVGIRLIASDIFISLFILVFMGHLFLMPKLNFQVPKLLKQFLGIVIIVFFFKLMSIIGLLLYASEHHTFIDGAASQYSLGIVKEIEITLFLVTLAVYLPQITAERRLTVVWIFIFGIIASCIYQYLSIYLMITSSFNLDEAVWPTISYGLPDTLSSVKNGIIGDGKGSLFFRAGGFEINPNALAASLVCIIPFLVFSYIEKRQLRYLILTAIPLMSLLFTLSISGMLAFAVALITLVWIEGRSLIRHFKLPLMVIFSILATFVILYYNELYELLKLRFGGGLILGARAQLNNISLELLSQHPFFGTGYNTSSEALKGFAKITNITGLNLHNFWAIKAVELGMIGFLVYLVLHFYILKVSYRLNNIFAKALFCTFIGLSFSGFFNNALANFPQQLFLYFMFILAILDKHQQRIVLPIAV